MFARKCPVHSRTWDTSICEALIAAYAQRMRSGTTTPTHFGPSARSTKSSAVRARPTDIGSARYETASVSIRK
jgi:hypothetical protein